MKKILAFLFLLVVGVSAQADSINRAAAASTGVGVLFATDSGVTAVTSTASTCVGPGAILKKLLLFPSVSSALSVTFTVWDAPNGVTGATGAKIIVPTHNATILPAATLSAPYVIDFMVGTGTNDTNPGLRIKNYLVIATSGTNTPNATAIYSGGLVNKTQGTNGSN